MNESQITPRNTTPQLSKSTRNDSDPRRSLGNVGDVTTRSIQAVRVAPILSALAIADQARYRAQTSCVGTRGPNSSTVAAGVRGPRHRAILSRL